MKPGANPAPGQSQSPRTGNSIAPPQTSPSPSRTQAQPASPPSATQPEARGLLPNGATLTVRVAAIGQPVATQSVPTGTTAAPTTASSPVLTGTVAGLTQVGRPVIATTSGFLALDARAEPRLGTPITLEVLSNRMAGSALGDRSAPLPVLAREWPALNDALRVLEESLGLAAANQLTQALARPGPQLTAALLFFMVALKGGDLRGWLGQDTARSLENAGRGGLLRAMGEDFQTLQRASEPTEAGWRAFVVPVDHEERRPIRFLFRRGRRESGRGQSGTAFLVDLHLTSFGPFRLDGMVRPNLLDLLVRTIEPLPTTMRHDIKALFDSTLDRTGIVGRLAFKNSPVMPPLPIADLETGDAGDNASLFV